MKRTCTYLIVAILVACLDAAAPVTASDITIGEGRTEISHGMVMIDADAMIEFSNDAIKALQSGIPLIFELDIRITRTRKYLWDPELFATQRRYSIERHALSEQYILTDLVTGERRIHGSLALAVEDLGRLRNLPVIEKIELDPAIPHTYKIRLRLDIESLPSPMIPLAYVSPSWRMSSGWHRWNSTP